MINSDAEPYGIVLFLSPLIHSDRDCSSDCVHDSYNANRIKLLLSLFLWFLARERHKDTWCTNLRCAGVERRMT